MTSCPKCGGRIAGITTRGPGEHVVSPCGHRVNELTVRDLLDDGPGDPPFPKPESSGTLREGTGSLPGGGRQ